MSLSISITGLEARRGGDEVQLTLRICNDRHSEDTRLIVASGMLFELGNIGVGCLPYELTREEFDTLEYDSKLWEAVKRGIDLLSYGDNTSSALIKKLRMRGFDKYLSEDAVQYIAKLGYIDESRILARSVEQLANVKLYGKSRIKSELYKKGVSREVISGELDELFDGIDFEENLRKLILKKCDFDSLDDRKYRESLYASMYRLGWSPTEVRAAIKSAF